MSVKLSDLRQGAQFHADMVNSTFLTTAEWNYHINKSAQYLYNKIIDTYEDYNRIQSPAITITTGNTFNLPSDFFKLRGIDREISSSTDLITVRPYQFIERNERSGQFPSSLMGNVDVSYSLAGNGSNATITLQPSLNAAATYFVWYVPELPIYVSDSDTRDGYFLTLNGWDSFIAIDVAIKALTKEETECSTLIQLRSDTLQMVIESASSFDAGDTFRIGDVHNKQWQMNYPWMRY